MTTTGNPMRSGRSHDALREVRLERGTAPWAEGSCLISAGQTRVLCVATILDHVPDWRRGSGEGWITAEYAMLPRSTLQRTPRERGKVGGRTLEIQRLIGRSLRAAADLAALGERTVILDCDVIGADGGTRTAAITGAAVALHDACSHLVRGGVLAESPMRELVAATSVGIVSGKPRLDLDYAEDVTADVDFNVVALEGGGLVEVQGTGERTTFSRTELDALVDLALGGIAELFRIQRAALGLA